MKQNFLFIGVRQLSTLLQSQTIAIQKVMRGDKGVGRHDLLGTAFFAIDAESVGCQLCGVVAIVGGCEIEGVCGNGVLGTLGVAFAIDLALGVEVMDDKGHDLHDLRVGECGFVGVKVAEAFDAVFFKHVEELKLVSCKLGFDVVRLTHEADIDARIGAGQHEDILAVEEVRVYVEYVRLAAEDAWNAEAHRAVRGESYIKDRIIAGGIFAVCAFFNRCAFGIGALKSDSVRRELENIDGAHYTASARGATVCNRRGFRF